VDQTWKIVWADDDRANATQTREELRRRCMVVFATQADQTTGYAELHRATMCMLMLLYVLYVMRHIRHPVQNRIHGTAHQMTRKGEAILSGHFAYFSGVYSFFMFSR
jgi:hypothetical protein